MGVLGFFRELILIYSKNGYYSHNNYIDVTKMGYKICKNKEDS
jgi:hypothetical protein